MKDLTIGDNVTYRQLENIVRNLTHVKDLDRIIIRDNNDYEHHFEVHETVPEIEFTYRGSLAISGYRKGLL